MASVLSELPPKPNNLQADKDLQADKGFLNEIISEAATAVGGVEAKLLEAELTVATTGTVAAADAVGNTIKTQGPKLLDNVKKGAEYLYEVVNTLKKLNSRQTLKLTLLL